MLRAPCYVLSSLADMWPYGQGVPVSDGSAKPAKRRWNAYVCPDCRLVFRIPTNHEGRGTVCPSCSRLLRIPKEGDPLPPLSQQLAAKQAD